MKDSKDSEAGRTAAADTALMQSKRLTEVRHQLAHPLRQSVVAGILALVVEGGGQALVAVCGNEISGHAMYARDEEQP
jgi:hypothetical protein